MWYQVKIDSPVYRTPGSRDSPVSRTLWSRDSLVTRTNLDLLRKYDSPVSRTLWSHDSPVSWTPGSRLKSRISPRKFVRIRKGPRAPLMGPGGADLWKKTGYKKSRGTVPLITAGYKVGVGIGKSKYHKGRHKVTARYYDCFETVMHYFQRQTC